MNKTINFICVGTQKAGTSTLHDILNQHPEIKLPKLKETHFFRDDEKFSKGMDYYFNYYFDNSEKKIIGEIDPEYSYFPGCAERIKQSLGTIKIIFVIRNPVDRAYSHYLMTKRRGLEDLPFEEAIRKEQERLDSHYNKIHFSYISRGYYSTQIKHFEKIFGLENIKIVLFDDLITKTEETIVEISDFLDLPDFEFNYNIKSNPASEAKNKQIRDFIYKPNKLKKLVGKIIPSQKLKDFIMFTLNKKNLKPVNNVKLENSEKEKIYMLYFKEEVEALEKRLNVSLSKWKYLINKQC